MNEIDTEKIKKMTNNLIAYENYEKEKKMKKEKLKKITFVFLAIFIVIGGTVTVDAATDNKISEAIKKALTIKVDGQDKNATCVKLENGNMKCTLDKEVTSGEEVSVEYNTDILKDDPEVTYNHTSEGDELSLTIKDEVINN